MTLAASRRVAMARPPLSRKEAIKVALVGAAQTDLCTM
jgi:hypothetical protein